MYKAMHKPSNATAPTEKPQRRPEGYLTIFTCGLVWCDERRRMLYADELAELFEGSDSGFNGALQA